MIRILCDEETAVMLFDSATRLHPEAATGGGACELILVESLYAW